MRRAALGDQVPQRPQRHGRRRAGHQRRDAGREPAFPAERRRRRARADGLLAGAARHQDAGGARWSATTRTPGRSRATWPDIPGCGKVFYPGLRLASAARAGQAAGLGFRRHDLVHPRRRISSDAGTTVFDRFRLFTRAESLGGVESLVCHPASMTHASVPRETRLAMGFCRRPAAPLGRDRGPGRFEG